MTKYPSNITPDTIVSLTAHCFDVSEGDIFRKDRTERFVVARQVAYWLVRKYLALSYPQIGEYFGRHHSTIIHGCREIDVISRDSRLGKCVVALCEVLNEQQVYYANELRTSPPVSDRPGAEAEDDSER